MAVLPSAHAAIKDTNKHMEHYHIRAWLFVLMYDNIYQCVLLFLDYKRTGGYLIDMLLWGQKRIFPQ